VYPGLEITLNEEKGFGGTIKRSFGPVDERGLSNIE
jgi:hypothetical protein